MDFAVGKKQRQNFALDRKFDRATVLLIQCSGLDLRIGIVVADVVEVVLVPNSFRDEADVDNFAVEDTFVVVVVVVADAAVVVVAALGEGCSLRI